MPDEHLILTTPPVHGGPEFGEKPIAGGDVAKTGLDSRLREAFEQVTNEVAAKVSLPIVVPVKQLVAATVQVVSDLPRVPDYDHVSASLTSWAEAIEYSPTEVPDADPDSIGVFVRDQGPGADRKVCIELTSPVNDATTTLDFDPAFIESFFLAGLAACAYAKAQAQK